jgi:hypothetical protein
MTTHQTHEVNHGRPVGVSCLDSAKVGLLWSRAIYSAAAIMFYGYFFLFISYYGRARASARSDHYVFALFFRIPFFYFLWSRASKRAQRPLCFCAVFSYSFFFYFLFFFIFFFIFFVTKFVGRLSYRTPSRTELKFGRQIPCGNTQIGCSFHTNRPRGFSAGGTHTTHSWRSSHAGTDGGVRLGMDYRGLNSQPCMASV